MSNLYTLFRLCQCHLDDIFFLFSFNVFLLASSFSFFEALTSLSRYNSQSTPCLVRCHISFECYNTSIDGTNKSIWCICCGVSVLPGIFRYQTIVDGGSRYWDLHFFLKYAPLGTGHDFSRPREPFSFKIVDGAAVQATLARDELRCRSARSAKHAHERTHSRRMYTRSSAAFTKT